MPGKSSNLRAVLVAVPLFLGGYFALTAFADWGLSGTKWLASSLLGGSEVATADVFDVPDSSNDVQAVAAVENLQNAIRPAIAILMGVGLVLSLLWWLSWRAKADDVTGPEAAGALKFLWLMLLLVLIVVAAGVGVYLHEATPLGSDMTGEGKTWLGLILGGTTLLLFWLATAWPTPNALRPSAPGSGWFPLHTKRG